MYFDIERNQSNETHAKSYRRSQGNVEDVHKISARAV